MARIHCVAVDIPAFSKSTIEEVFLAAQSETVHIWYVIGELRVIAYKREQCDAFLVATLDVLIDELGWDPEDIPEPQYYSCIGPPPPAGGGVSPPAGGGVSPRAGDGVSSPSVDILKSVVYDVHNDTSQMMVVPTEASRALVLAELIGSKERVELSRLSLAHRVQDDSSCAWVGMQVWEVSIRWRRRSK